MHREYSTEEIDSVIKITGLRNIFLEKGLTLDYVIKENGQNISGGQKQRIAMARALIQNKSVLILDEGASAMEQKSSYELEQQLLGKSDLTLLVITHKISEKNLKRFDEIIVINDGTIEEVVEFTSLIEKRILCIK